MKSTFFTPKFLFTRLFCLLPFFLILLFEWLKQNSDRMNAWVMGFVAPVEQFLGRVCSKIPFLSIAECITAFAIISFLVFLVNTVVSLIRTRTFLFLFKRIGYLVCALAWLWAAFCWMWNAVYYIPSLTQRCGLSATPHSVEELANVTAYFAHQAGTLASQVPRDANGHFEKNLEDYFQNGRSAYDVIAQEFPCLQMESVQAKPLLCSPLQSALGFTGVYFPFTGEANINTDSPACLIPATIAHEMAHQRMIAPEQEANFAGIAACITSDNLVFQYSGYLMGLIHLSNALYSVSPSHWQTIVDTFFTPELRTDWNDNNNYWAERASAVEETAETVYDSFLKRNQQDMGIQSYGACVDLLVSYVLPKLSTQS